jgi:hypothetical protein
MRAAADPSLACRRKLAQDRALRAHGAARCAL